MVSDEEGFQFGEDHVANVVPRGVERGDDGLPRRRVWGTGGRSIVAGYLAVELEIHVHLWLWEDPTAAGAYPQHLCAVFQYAVKAVHGRNVEDVPSVRFHRKGHMVGHHVNDMEQAVLVHVGEALEQPERKVIRSLVRLQALDLSIRRCPDVPDFPWRRSTGTEAQRGVVDRELAVTRVEYGTVPIVQGEGKLIQSGSEVKEDISNDRTVAWLGVFVRLKPEDVVAALRVELGANFIGLVSISPWIAQSKACKWWVARSSLMR